MADFCTNCGSRLEQNTKFCTACGGATSMVDSTASVVPQQNSAVSEPRKGGHKLFKVVLLLLALIILLVMGSCAYIGYRAKKKLDELKLGFESPVSHQPPESSAGGGTDKPPAETGSGAGPEGLGKMMGVLAGALTGNSASTPSYPSWTAGDSSRIPLKDGLVLVASHHVVDGDRETIERIDSSKPQSVGMAVSEDKQSSSGNEPPQSRAAHRTVLRRDLQNSHQWVQNVQGSDPDVLPGSTFFSISCDALNELRQKGETSFLRRATTLETIISISSSNDTSLGNSKKNAKKVTDDSDFAHCTLTRVGKVDEAFPLIVNDQRTQVPALHASCVSESAGLDLYFLDDPGNAILLGGVATGLLGMGERWQVIKISFPQESPIPQIEQSLQQTGRAEVYGIYFDFGSDRIRAESAPVLREIAQAMNDNPSWKLSVEGHTDNVGGDAYNLDLSNRRAAAVKQALVTSYHIAPDRLSTVGYGATRPKESNDTLEGRARNRRVELERQ
jgi:outer membrane protein OmpA-like peptidoglycan-associated protein